jgi:hypothetical protein
MITSCEQWMALVEQVARMPEVITTTLREHTPTPEGRCATCHVGNIVTAQAQHPCRSGTWPLLPGTGGWLRSSSYSYFDLKK